MNHDDVVDLISKELERLSPVWHHERGLSIARKLLDAGYLVTPAMERAVEACKAHAHRFGGCTIPEMDACTKAGQAALAEEAERAPKPPRQVYGIHEFVGDPEPTNWCVTRNDHQWLMNLTKPEAHAICLSLRGLERGK